ncbi:hypothetical protein BKA56DRAFT_576996 [Ilyonectria sp. MPI-CAGE-AT-0026]|nr:hypothetical protein BKA56DRAFT_576996 [Ilyonectria sp. MPI-CAGE-AT-0026]
MAGVGFFPARHICSVAMRHCPTMTPSSKPSHLMCPSWGPTFSPVNKEGVPTGAMAQPTVSNPSCSHYLELHNIMHG